MEEKLYSQNKNSQKKFVYCNARDLMAVGKTATAKAD
jgi:hypothetical protein